MSRLILCLCIFVLLSNSVGAVEASIDQIRIGPQQILRGSFAEERTLANAANPMTLNGHFVVAPSYGLLWSIEMPMATTTIINKYGAVQDLGGITMKLSAKNLRHLYDLVHGALAGNWAELETDFVVTKTQTGDHWQMVLVPRPDAPHSAYATITVSGSRYVEMIVLLNAQGVPDTFRFTNEAVTPLPLNASEAALFSRGAK